MAPQFEEAAKELEPAVRLLELNAETEQAAAGELRITGVPALILFRDGRFVARTAGAMQASQIVQWTRQTLAQAV